MNRFWVGIAVVFAAGLRLTGAGFVYDILFAGIPYQDAQTHLQDQYTFHANGCNPIGEAPRSTNGAASVTLLYTTCPAC